MEYTQQDKLDQFEQAILKKAETERAAILAETEQLKKSELDREENLLLEELYHHIQTRIGEIKTENLRTVSRENLALKKQLYSQREQYLGEVIARARAELAAFVKTDGYPAYMRRKAKALAEGFRHEGSTIFLRAVDLPYLDMVEEVYGPCRVQADDGRIALGGMILENPARGIEVDYSLDTALEEQRDWFYNHSNFHFE